MNALFAYVRRAAAPCLVSVALLSLPLVVSAGTTVTGPMGFDPIPGSAYAELDSTWAVPFLVPNGFSQHLVSDETDDLGGNGGLDIYAGSIDDLTDMNTVNEEGKHAGRYLYRTHEVGSSGAVSVVDLETGESKILAQDASWSRLDGIRWTPWKTILFAEETTGGRVFEIALDKKDPSVAASVTTRLQLGRMAHEGIEVGSDGAVYVIDELNGGSIYRYVPESRGDLSDGQLYALKINDLTNAQQLWVNYNAVTNPHTGDFEWVALDMDDVIVDSRAAADAVNATEFGRPEDLEIIGQTLYVANTTENRVLAIHLNTQVVDVFVASGLNTPVENGGLAITGFRNPDNLAEGPDGRLWIVEDNVPSDIWVAAKDLNGDGAADAVHLFASMVDEGAEGTGIYFGKDPKVLFVNVQHAAKSKADGTWAIVKD
jgi:secreted PhoX family phosphatase